jgi:hypothetical protein
MRLFRPIVRISRSIADNIGHQLTMSDSMAAQLVRYDLPRFTTMISDQTPEKSLCRFPIAPRL